jgi:hypothetical protein
MPPWITPSRALKGAVHRQMTWWFTIGVDQRHTRRRRGAGSCGLVHFDGNVAGTTSPRVMSARAIKRPCPRFWRPTFSTTYQRVQAELPYIIGGDLFRSGPRISVYTQAAFENLPTYFRVHVDLERFIMSFFKNGARLFMCTQDRLSSYPQASYESTTT